MKRIPKDMAPGTIHKTKTSGELEILSYQSYNSVTVIFKKTGYSTTVEACQIRRMEVKDHFLPSVYGVGFFGVGNFKATCKGRNTTAYNKWLRMIQRCYDKTYHDKSPTYRDCTVCEEWHNFQNFAKWFYENYPNDGKDYQLDKDIKVDGNKLYSPDTCMFVSALENSVKANARHFKFIDPNGNYVDVFNLSEFCKENNLNRSCMSAVSLGKRKEHKGWTKGA